MKQIRSKVLKKIQRNRREKQSWHITIMNMLDSSCISVVFIGIRKTLLACILYCNSTRTTKFKQIKQLIEIN